MNETEFRETVLRLLPGEKISDVIIHHAYLICRDVIKDHKDSDIIFAIRSSAAAAHDGKKNEEGFIVDV